MKNFTMTDRFDSTGKPADLETVNAVLATFGYEITGERCGHLYASNDGGETEIIVAEINE